MERKKHVKIPPPSTAPSLSGFTNGHFTVRQQAGVEKMTKKSQQWPSILKTLKIECHTNVPGVSNANQYKGLWNMCLLIFVVKRMFKYRKGFLPKIFYPQNFYLISKTIFMSDSGSWVSVGVSPQVVDRGPLYNCQVWFIISIPSPGWQQPHHHHHKPGHPRLHVRVIVACLVSR